MTALLKQQTHRDGSFIPGQVVVVGGGSGGLAVAGQLARDPLFAGKKDLLVIDPSAEHYYQPLWTFVGAGLKPFSESKKPMRELIPSSVSILLLVLRWQADSKHS